MKTGLVAAWAAGMGIVIWRMVHRDHQMPVPGALLGVSGLFAGLALISDVWPATTTLVTVTAVGLDVAAFMNVPGAFWSQVTRATQTSAAAEGLGTGGTGGTGIHGNAAPVITHPAAGG